MNDVSTVNAAAAVQFRLANLVMCIDRLHKNNKKESAYWSLIRRAAGDLAMALSEGPSGLHDDIRAPAEMAAELGDPWKSML